MFPTSIHNIVKNAEIVYRTGIPSKWAHAIDREFIKFDGAGRPDQGFGEFLIPSAEFGLNLIYKNINGTLTCVWRYPGRGYRNHHSS